MEIKSFGYGKFEATNGVDVVNAEFERGKKGEDGKFHPHWNLSINGHPSVFWGGKDETVEYIRKLIAQPMDEPLSTEKAQKIQEQDGTVHGIVSVELSEMIECDLEAFLNMLNERLTEALLSDIYYRAVGISLDGNYLFFRASGRILFLEESESDEQCI